ncbi:MAG TPA: hypothetical protein VNI01_01050, partial [Elusimicrobiota bacterium]|nr:hypothetical protein [Elusimicrobiota bacterium]
MPLAALIALLAASASADTVHLKNGRTMEGMVQSEDKKELVLDIGYGTVTLQRADVARIERAAGSSRAALEKENRLRGFEA